MGRVVKILLMLSLFLSLKQTAQPLHDPEQLADCTSFTALSSHPEQHGPSAPSPFLIAATPGRAMEIEVLFLAVLDKTENFRFSFCITMWYRTYLDHEANMQTPQRRAPNLK